MRHLKSGRKLNRTSAHRKALMRNLVTSLIERGRIRTTDAKAKELRQIADRLVTLGNERHCMLGRQAAAFVRTRAAVRKLFDEIAPRFANRSGGYTRVIKLGRRVGDAAPISLIEFVEYLEAAGSGSKKSGSGRAS